MHGHPVSAKGFIESLQKISCCPLKNNHWRDNSGGNQLCQRVAELIWSAKELAGKRIKSWGFPKNFKMNLSLSITAFFVGPDILDGPSPESRRFDSSHPALPSAASRIRGSVLRFPRMS